MGLNQKNFSMAVCVKYIWGDVNKPPSLSFNPYQFQGLSAPINHRPRKQSSKMWLTRASIWGRICSRSGPVSVLRVLLLQKDRCYCHTIKANLHCILQCECGVKLSSNYWPSIITTTCICMESDKFSVVKFFLAFWIVILIIAFFFLVTCVIPRIDF